MITTGYDKKSPGHEYEVARFYCTHCGHTSEDCEKQECLCEHCCENAPWKEDEEE